MALRHLIESGREALDLQDDIAGAPDPVNRYYRACRDKGGNAKEYCARVAWSIYCSRKNPGHPGCTRYGKNWGRPYSTPLSQSKTESKRRPRAGGCGCGR